MKNTKLQIKPVNRLRYAFLLQFSNWLNGVAISQNIVSLLRLPGVPYVQTNPELVPLSRKIYSGWTIASRLRAHDTYNWEDKMFSK